MNQLFDVLITTVEGDFVTIISGLEWGVAIAEAESWEQFDDVETPYRGEIGSVGCFDEREYEND